MTTDLIGLAERVEQGSGADVECPTCGGDGQFDEGPHPTMMCPTCKGKGRVEDDRLVTVCDCCLQASCWQGIFMCWESQDAGTVEKPVSELRALGREHPSYWDPPRRPGTRYMMTEPISKEARAYIQEILEPDETGRRPEVVGVIWVDRYEAALQAAEAKIAAINDRMAMQRASIIALKEALKPFATECEELAAKFDAAEAKIGELRERQTHFLRKLAPLFDDSNVVTSPENDQTRITVNWGEFLSARDAFRARAALFSTADRGDGRWSADE